MRRPCSGGNVGQAAAGAQPHTDSESGRLASTVYYVAELFPQVYLAASSFCLCPLGFYLYTLYSILCARMTKITAFILQFTSV
jgi:hypothetical protein